MKVHVGKLELIFCIVLCLVSPFFGQNTDFLQSLSSVNYINWQDGTFLSDIELDVQKAKISLPSGRNVANNRIEHNLLYLVKNPLMTIRINSSSQLSDAIMREQISVSDISKIIADGVKTPTVFSKAGDTMIAQHTISLQALSKALIKHENPYTPNIPIDRVSTRPYSGIIIDARGQLPVQGEFTTEPVQAALFPRIWDADMNLLYEINMVEPEIVRTAGLVGYASSLVNEVYKDRVGNDPLRITARSVYGIHRTDPIISKNDALKILSIPENVQLLKEGKVVILLDEEYLSYQVQSPFKDQNYYYTMEEVSNHIFETELPDLDIIDSEKGMLIPLRDLKFVSDSSILLPEENKRLDVLAQALLIATKDSNNSVLIEGHTASVGKIEGERILSVERAEVIMQELIKRGVNKDLFTIRGYGGEFPIGDNTTDEGRAANRRVEITIVPKQTYIQRM